MTGMQIHVAQQPQTQCFEPQSAFFWNNPWQQHGSYEADPHSDVHEVERRNCLLCIDVGNLQHLSVKCFDRLGLSAMSMDQVSKHQILCMLLNATAWKRRDCIWLNSSTNKQCTCFQPNIFHFFPWVMWSPRYCSNHRRTTSEDVEASIEICALLRRLWLCRVSSVQTTDQSHLAFFSVALLLKCSCRSHQCISKILMCGLYSTSHSMQATWIRETNFWAEQGGKSSQGHTWSLEVYE